MKGCDFCRYYRETYAPPLCCLRDGRYVCAPCFEELERRLEYEIKSITMNFDIASSLFEYVENLNQPLRKKQQ
jgi:hypothetical protein